MVSWKILYLTSQGHIFFIRTLNWVILDLLESLRNLLSIHIKIRAMGGHSKDENIEIQ